MLWLGRLGDKTGTLGTFVTAMGCASCFPAMGVLASSLGLGFLAQFEGIFINTLLPVFAAIALTANVLSFFSHKNWYRALLGVIGPLMVLLMIYPFWSYDWSTYLLYAGITMMLLVSLWDVFSPANKICSSKRI